MFLDYIKKDKLLLILFFEDWATSGGTINTDRYKNLYSEFVYK